MLALTDEGTPVWFRLTVDLATHRVVAEQMIARARFLDTRFTDFGRASRSRRPVTRSPARRALRAAGILAAVAFVALLVYGLTSKATNSTIDDALSRGEAVPAPGFTLSALADGLGRRRRLVARRPDRSVSLRELRGTPLVLNFWTSWCDPCRAEAKVLERAWKAPSGGVLFLGLDVQDAREDARDFIASSGSRSPTSATRATTPSALGRHGLPETYFIAADGRVVGHVIGTVDAAAARARGSTRPRPGARWAPRTAATAAGRASRARAAGRPARDVDHALDLRPRARDRHVHVGAAGALVRGDQQAQARGVDERDVPEVEHELARVVGEHAVQDGLQREGGGHVEVAGEAELDGVAAGVLVDRSRSSLEAFPVSARANRLRL